MSDKNKGLEIAAQLWCLPDTEHLVMIPELCEAIAYRIDPMLGEIGELKEKLQKVKQERDKLRACLLEAMEWNWLDEDAPPRFDLDNLPDVNEVERELG